MAKIKNNKPNRSNKKGNQKKKALISNVPTKKEEKVGDGIVVYEEGITVGELAEKINQTQANVI